MENLDHYINFIAYAAGFATGNFVGMIIEEKLAMGILMIRVFANERGERTGTDPELTRFWRNCG